MENKWTTPVYHKSVISQEASGRGGGATTTLEALITPVPNN